MIKFDLFTRRVAARVLSASISPRWLCWIRRDFSIRRRGGRFRALARRGVVDDFALAANRHFRFAAGRAHRLGRRFPLARGAARDARRARLRIFAARGGGGGGGGGGDFGGGAFFGGRIRFGSGRKRLASFGRSGGARGARFWPRFVAARRRRLRARRASRIRGRIFRGHFDLSHLADRAADRRHRSAARALARRRGRGGFVLGFARRARYRSERIVAA